MENYLADAKRYENGMQYERCGRSGVLLPKVSLGMWHNFGSVDPYERSREIVRYAFDHGVTHLDLANNYGPAPGSMTCVPIATNCLSLPKQVTACGQALMVIGAHANI